MAWPKYIYNSGPPKVLALPATLAPPPSQHLLLTVSLGWTQSPGHVTAAQWAPLIPSLPKCFCCWCNFLPRKVLNTAEVCNWQPLFWELYYKHLTCIESLNWRRSWRRHPDDVVDTDRRHLAKDVIIMMSQREGTEVRQSGSWDHSSSSARKWFSPKGNCIHATEVCISNRDIWITSNALVVTEFIKTNGFLKSEACSRSNATLHVSCS